MSLKPKQKISYNNNFPFSSENSQYCKTSIALPPPPQALMISFPFTCFLWKHKTKQQYYQSNFSIANPNKSSRINHDLCGPWIPLLMVCRENWNLILSSLTLPFSRPIHVNIVCFANRSPLLYLTLPNLPIPKTSAFVGYEEFWRSKRVLSTKAN